MRQQTQYGRPVLTLKRAPQKAPEPVRASTPQAKQLKPAQKAPGPLPHPSKLDFKGRWAGANSILRQSKAWVNDLPLAVGFHKQALSHTPDEWTAVVLKRIKYRVGSHDYLRNLIKGGPRYAWDGAEAGEIKPEHQRLAAKQLAAKPKGGYRL